MIIYDEILCLVEKKKKQNVFCEEINTKHKELTTDYGLKRYKTSLTGKNASEFWLNESTKRATNVVSAGSE